MNMFDHLLGWRLKGKLSKLNFPIVLNISMADPDFYVVVCLEESLDEELCDVC